MANILVVYGSDEGQTEKIARHIARKIEKQGHKAEFMHGRALPHKLPLLMFDGIVVGASIHAGQHQIYIQDFVKQNVVLLEQLPSAFFSVSLTAAEDQPEAQDQVNTYLTEFSEQTGWHPGHVGVFGGALKYNQYDLVQKMIVKTVSQKANALSDTSVNYEYTDWRAVDRFAKGFLTSLKSHHHHRSNDCALLL